MTLSVRRLWVSDGDADRHAKRTTLPGPPPRGGRLRDAGVRQPLPVPPQERPQPTPCRRRKAQDHFAAVVRGVLDEVEDVLTRGVPAGGEPMCVSSVYRQMVLDRIAPKLPSTSPPPATPAPSAATLAPPATSPPLASMQSAVSISLFTP
eukprot:Hpha_TRINITY_DN879_c0_g1::TRINITY_DN879_c0_g1_i1::g.194905::m.194905